jgi:hypothetical protein
VHRLELRAVSLRRVIDCARLAAKPAFVRPFPDARPRARLATPIIGKMRSALLVVVYAGCRRLLNEHFSC